MTENTDKAFEILVEGPGLKISTDGKVLRFFSELTDKGLFLSINLHTVPGNNLEEKIENATKQAFETSKFC